MASGCRLVRMQSPHSPTHPKHRPSSGAHLPATQRAQKPTHPDQVAALMAEGRVKPLVDRVLPLEAVAEAHVLSDSGRARGKIVLSCRHLTGL